MKRTDATPLSGTTGEAISHVAGLPVGCPTLESAIDLLWRDAGSTRPRLYVCLNAHSAWLRRRVPAYEAMLRAQETVALADGASLEYGARLLGEQQVRRVSGAELLEAAAARAAADGTPMFLLGGDRGIGSLLQTKLEESHEGLRIVGTLTPPFGYWSSEESLGMCAAVRASGARILWVGVSAPKQEIWAHQFLHELGMPVVCIGAAFDFLSGAKRRAPKWMRQLGVEWVFRLVTEPRRLWKRYLVGNTLFVADLIRYGTHRPNQRLGFRPQTVVACSDKASSCSLRPSAGKEARRGASRGSIRRVLGASPPVEMTPSSSRSTSLVLGCGGMLGRACLDALGPGTVGCDYDDFDIADRQQTLTEIARLHPLLIVNCAGATDVDRCELDHDYADRANTIGPGNVAEAAAAVGARMVHISTDFVFDGTKGESYRETDVPAPISYYGLSKLGGEREVFARLPSALVVRTSWLYGEGTNHFPARVLSWATGRKEIRIADDQFGSPTYAEDLVHGICALVAAGAQGIFHLAGSGCVTRYELAQETLTQAGLDIKVVRVSASQFPLLAPRPFNTCLDCSKAAGLGIELPPWRDSLARYLRSSSIG